MKKITILLIALMIGFFTTQAQTISIIGDAVGGWDSEDDVDLATTDSNIYTISGLTIISGGLKFRQDNAWTISWGGTEFPNGTGDASGDNIPAIAGTYDVTFNLTTLAYEFVSTTTYTEIGIIGSAINGGSTDDTDMNTTDGENYFLDAFNVTTGDAHFRQDNAETVNWSDSAFPSGTGTQGGSAIAVTANDYNITLNITSGAYSFNYVDISLIGDFNSWGGDTDLTTTDGENYTIDGFVLTDAGGVKFRQNHDWNVNWGDGGGNIALSADTYNVTFVRSTGVYTFTGSSTFAEIGIIGSAINGGSMDDTDMSTEDGVNYSVKALNVTTGDAHFRQDNTETINWSDSAFPSGTGTQGGSAIAVTANDYNIMFNNSTGAYSFNFLDISLIGDFNSWGGDTDLTTADGENYTLDGFVLSAAGGLKFRQNHNWDVNWGDGGDNIALTADTYNVTFVRSTGAYTFTSTTASVNDYDKLNRITIYPTITNTSFKANKELTSVVIYSISGQMVKSFNGDFGSDHAFNVSELTPALYYVTLESNEGKNMQRLIVK